jgi:hypothetical protein
MTAQRVPRAVILSAASDPRGRRLRSLPAAGSALSVLGTASARRLVVLRLCQAVAVLLQRLDALVHPLQDLLFSLLETLAGLASGGGRIALLREGRSGGAHEGEGKGEGFLHDGSCRVREFYFARRGSAGQQVFGIEM